MKHPQTIENLRNALEPYRFFWEEWIQYGDCNLSPAEISTIQTLKGNDGLLADWTFASNDELDMVRNTTKKLQIGYQLFKDYVVVNFLKTIIQLANENGYDLFLNTPIQDLTISEDLKNCLLKFKTLNIRMLFLTYKAAEFSVGWVYKVIVEFQTIKKTKANIYINKPEFT